MPISTAHLHRLLLRWYVQKGRKLPWRGIKNPYRVLISEIMLQQTQVSRVLVKYPEFIERFPDFQRLASARVSEVIRVWHGMGYNNRAVRLHRLAGIVVSTHHGRLPTTVETLLDLPGVGPYTAHAIACFALGEPIATVDTNIRRVFFRLFPNEAKSLGEWEVARRVLPRRRAYHWNQALMDLGALVCTATAPSCGECPLRKHCPSAFRKIDVRGKKPVNETLVAGLPNRIYRGRIVEALRHASKQGVKTEELGIRIRAGYSIRHRAWLQSLLDSLRKDGVIILRRRGSILRASLAE